MWICCRHFGVSHFFPVSNLTLTIVDAILHAYTLQSFVDLPKRLDCFAYTQMQLFQHQPSTPGTPPPYLSDRPHQHHFSTPARLGNASNTRLNICTNQLRCPAVRLTSPNCHTFPSSVSPNCLNTSVTGHEVHRLPLVPALSMRVRHLGEGDSGRWLFTAVR